MSHWCWWHWSWFCSTKYICTWSSFNSFSPMVTLELVLLNKIYLYMVKLYFLFILFINKIIQSKKCLIDVGDIGAGFAQQNIFVHGQALWLLVLLNKIYICTRSSLMVTGLAQQNIYLYTVKPYGHWFCSTKYICIRSSFTFIHICWQSKMYINTYFCTVTFHLLILVAICTLFIILQ